MKFGKVIAWRREKLYGWLAVDGEEDIFFHGSHVVSGKAGLRVGQEVTFEVGVNPHNSKTMAILVTSIAPPVSNDVSNGGFTNEHKQSV